MSQTLRFLFLLGGLVGLSHCQRYLPNNYPERVDMGYLATYQNPSLAFQIEYNGDYRFAIDSLRWKTLDLPRFLRKQLKKDRQADFEILFTAHTNGSPYYRSAGMVYPRYQAPDTLANLVVHQMQDQTDFHLLDRSYTLLQAQVALRLHYRLSADDHEYEFVEYLIGGDAHILRLLFVTYPEKPVTDADLVMGQMPMVRVFREAGDIMVPGFAPLRANAETSLPDPFAFAQDLFRREANYGGVLHNLEEKRATYTKGRLRGAYQQAMATWYAALQDYSSAREAYRSAFAKKEDPRPSAEQYRVADQLRGVPAREVILAKADSAQVLILNEAHHDPAGRALLQDLLPDLWEKGYRHLGMEALMPGDTTLAHFGFPTVQTGFYTREPQFAATLRSALAMGYHLFDYEADQPCRPGPDAPPRYCANFRDRRQAERIAAYLDQHPGEKVVLFCGYDHVEERARNGWVKMAENLQQVSGIDPLTVDQTTLNGQRPNTWYTTLQERVVGREPMVLQQFGRYWMPPGRAGFTDLVVYHPPPQWQAGFPAWYTKGKVWTTLDLSDTQGTRWLQIFHDQEWRRTQQAVPVLQIPAHRMEKKLRVPLMAGTYVLVLRDLNGAVLGEMSLQVR